MPRHKILWVIALLVSTIFLLPNLSLSAQERRTALVIGNGSYKSAPLRNPVNDAEDMAKTLRKLGFTVIHKQNAIQREMEALIRKFGKQLRKGGVGLFYYAGHGFQVNGINYIIPLDAEIREETDVKYEAVDARRVLDAMYNAGNDLNIVILDACRDNPLARGFRSGSSGLARMDAPKGTIVAYSTSPGKLAFDGKGRNSPYTAALVDYMDDPGLTIEQVFKKCRRRIDRATNGKQIPWESTSLTGDFYFSTKGKDNRFSEEQAKLERERREFEQAKAEFERQRKKSEKQEVYVANLSQKPEYSQPSSSSVREIFPWIDIVNNDMWGTLSAEKKSKVFRGYMSELAQTPEWQELNGDQKFKVTQGILMEGGLGKLSVKTFPSRSTVRILNIRPKFSQGMVLLAGSYHVEVSKTDYKTKKMWVKLGSGESKQLEIRLEQLHASIQPTPTYIPPSSTSNVLKKDGIYVAYDNGIVKDTKTGLEWKTGPDENTNWNEANSWVQSLNLDGGSWRMPTMNELIGLYKKGMGDRNMTPLLKTTGWWVWSGETKGYSARDFSFHNGYRYWDPHYDKINYRAFAVRSRNDAGRADQLQASVQNNTPVIHPTSTSNVIKRDGIYVAYANGIVKDTARSLEWIAGPDRNTDWYEAKAWVQSLNLDGGGWRMPTTDELKGLYKKDLGSHNLTSLLLNTTSEYLWVWSGETKGSSAAIPAAWHFFFYNGYGGWDYRSASASRRAFAVRSRRGG
ncbi:MAG: caspase family protein [Deltaproteobacteria bacterium]|nr:caspase family protein [Deltaproteobacteria bacterium]